MIEKEPRKANPPPAATSFQEAWRVELGGLKLAQSTGDRHGGICLGKDGTATLLDHRGRTLWTVPLGMDIRTVSIAETMEVLAVQEGGSAILIDPMGQILWRKRVLPALAGQISGSGQFFGFVTRDPTVVLADRSSRAKWTYRNLLKAPPALELTHDGETVAFACQDERGEGIIALDLTGKPIAAFMGLDPVVDLALSRYGNLVFALDKAGEVFSFNTQTGAGVWKTRSSPEFCGISYAEDSRQTLLFSRSGALCLLDPDGHPQWESRLEASLLTARISADGQSIWLATAAGAVIGLESQAPRDMTVKGFADVPPPSPSSPTRSIQKFWQCELPRPAAGDSPRCLLWTGGDQVEYALLWDGRDRLACLNDLGEEIWNTRISGGPLRGLAVSAEADFAVLTAGQGVLGLRLDGTEDFRAIGTFRAAHVFGSGAYLLLDEAGRVFFSPNPGHPALPLALPEPIQTMGGTSGRAGLVGQQNVFLLTDEGKVAQTIPGAGLAAFFGLLPAPQGWILGEPAGDLHFFNWNGEEIYRYAQDSEPPDWVVFHPGEDVVFLGNNTGPEVVVLQNRLQNRLTISLQAPPRLAAPHPDGAIVCTTVDEVLLVTCAGEIPGRYPFPDRILEIFPGRAPDCFYLLSEGFFGKFSFPAAPGSGPATAGPVPTEGVVDRRRHGGRILGGPDL